MTTDHDLKALIRARMAKTGESYTAARQHLLGRESDAEQVLTRMGTRMTVYRLTAAELKAAADDFPSCVAVLAGAEAAGRSLDLDKGWIEIELVLGAHGFEVEDFAGRRLLPRDPTWDAPETFGEDEQRFFAGPTYLTPDEVLQVARRVTLTPFDELVETTDPSRFPDDWARSDWPGMKGYAAPAGLRFQEIYSAAAAGDQALVFRFR